MALSKIKKLLIKSELAQTIKTYFMDVMISNDKIINHVVDNYEVGNKNKLYFENFLGTSVDINMIIKIIDNDIKNFIKLRNIELIFKIEEDIIKETLYHNINKHYVFDSELKINEKDITKSELKKYKPELYTKYINHKHELNNKIEKQNKLILNNQSQNIHFYNH